MTQIISLHIKLQETVPAGSINVFITSQSHNFPPGGKIITFLQPGCDFQRREQENNCGSFYIKTSCSNSNIIGEFQSPTHHNLPFLPKDGVSRADEEFTKA